MPGRVLLAVLFALNIVSAQSALTQERNISVALKASLTTASRVFTNPNSPDAFERSQFFSLEDFLGYGVEISYQLPETNVAFGLSTDYIRTIIVQSIRISTS